jgi:2-iminobutanoate/2-iminopropanoate deaminase
MAISEFKHPIRTEQAPAPFQGAPYAQAIRYENLIFVSGQLGIDPETGELVEGGVAEQTKRAMQNVNAILEEAGSGAKQLLKTTIYLADLGDFQAMNEVYATFLGPQPPARATIQAAALPSGALVEIEGIGYL